MSDPAFADGSCFVLLDDCSASSASPTSRLYTEYTATLICRRAGTLAAFLSELQHALRTGHLAVGLFTYELGERLSGVVPDDDDSAEPLAQILLFNHCRKMTAEEVELWLHDDAIDAESGSTAGRPQAGIANVRANISGSDFHHAIARIHAYIESGDTYQVNYTYRLHFDAYGPAHLLYAKLRQRQPVPYGALISLPDGKAVLSLSPELFIRHEQGRLTARPMKGTAPASETGPQDAERSAALSNDPKGRAENVMIVDLLRNDLGRIAALGSVQVPHLFDVQRHGSVLQMTSTITAELHEQSSLLDLFKAIYPCGSITGAPKHRTMQIIRELEPAPRGIYTGAIGWFDAPETDHHIGNFCLSVPIRTVVLQADKELAVRSGEMGVGAGIVFDSRAAEEYEECQLKARFLTGLGHQFELIETIHATRESGCRHLDLHLQRLRNSATYFGFAFDEDQIRAGLNHACMNLDVGAYRLRLSLNHTGTYALQTAPLTALLGPVKLLLASEQIKAEDLFLRHKTTVRQHYDAAWRLAEAHGAFDMVFCNTRGEITEGARSNIFIKLAGRWYTPPLESGLLPGVMRSVLLSDPSWNSSERVLTLEDLRRAEDVMLCNALRGTLQAKVIWPQ